MQYNPLIDQTIIQFGIGLTFFVFYKILTFSKFEYALYFKISLNIAAIYIMATFLGGSGWKIAVALMLYFALAWLSYDYVFLKKLRVNNETYAFYIFVFFLVVIWYTLKGSQYVFAMGISYLFFKLIYTAYFSRKLNIKNIPSRLDYFEYVFFPVTLPSGPINPYHVHSTPPKGLLSDKFQRLVAGLIKLKILSPIIYTLTYTEISDSGYALDLSDYILCAVSCYLFMYLNFSGLTDIVIAFSSMLGKSTKENFDNPLKSLSVIDFWRRWHLSLTDLVRDIVFNPMYFILIKRYGIGAQVWSVIVSMSMAFIIMAMWHGFTDGFLLYYSINAVGFAINYLFQYICKDYFSTAYEVMTDSILYKTICWLITFSFVSFSYLLLNLGGDSWKLMKNVL